MTQQHNDNCLSCESMLHLIAQQTSHHLQIEALKLLEKLPAVLKVSAFEVRGKIKNPDDLTALVAYAEPDNSEPDDASHALAQMAQHTTLAACVKSQQLQRFFNDSHSLCFVPVKRHKMHLDVWVVEFADVIHEGSLQSIMLLAEVYYHCDIHITSHHHDPLTGLENRRALSERLSHILQPKDTKRRREEDQSVMPSVCLLDIDFFKRVNDNFGHLYGDEVLLLFAGLMKKTFREYDYLYRYGGEEFVALLDTHSESETMFVLERFRQAVENYEFPQVGHITVSIGFVQLHSTALPSSLFDQADQALYYAKENGRNQVRSYQKLLASGLIKDEKVKVESELF